MYQDHNTVLDDANKKVIPCLTKEKLVIVLAAESTKADKENLT